MIIQDLVYYTLESVSFHIRKTYSLLYFSAELDVVAIRIWNICDLTRRKLWLIRSRLSETLHEQVMTGNLL